MKNQPTPTSYAEALAILDLGRTRDLRDRKKIAPNMYLERLDGTFPGLPDRIGVRLHNTYVVTFHRSGAVSLDSGGWRTVTTKERINRYLAPRLSLFQEKHVWYVQDRRPQFLVRPIPSPQWDKRYRVEFQDGLLILPDASLHGQDRTPVGSGIGTGRRG